MSARAAIHAMFPLDETATAVLDQRLDAHRVENFTEAAAFVGNDDTCGCGGCDTCYARHLAAGLLAMAGEKVADARQFARTEAADWLASYPFPSSDSDWERGRDDALAWVVRVLRNPGPQRGAATGQGLDARLNEHRSEVLNEGAEAIDVKQDEHEAEERKRHGSLDHETVLQGEAVRDMAALLRQMAAGETVTAPAETAIEYGISLPADDDGPACVLNPTGDKTDAARRLGRYRDRHPGAVLVQRAVTYGGWIDVTEAGTR